MRTNKVKKRENFNTRELTYGGDTVGIIGTVDIGLSARRETGGVGALDTNRLNGSEEVSVGGVVRVTPVDHASCPFNSALT